MPPRPVGCWLSAFAAALLLADLVLYGFVYFIGGFNDNGDPDSAAGISAALTVLGRAGWGLAGLFLLGLFVAYGRRSGRGDSLDR